MALGDDDLNPYLRPRRAVQTGGHRPPAGVQTWQNGGSAGAGDGKDGGKDGKDGKDGGGYKAKAARRYIDQAETLALQAKALRAALGKKGFKHALKQKLDNVNLSVRQQDDELLREYGERVGSLENAAADNEKAANSQGFANLSNAGRERANALSEVMAQGGGESDMLRAQQMSLRNWNQNQNEVNRSFFDTLTSVNSSLTDLTADTRTARMNNAIQGNADKEQLWTNYYGQRSETMTQLGNTLGQMAEYYGMANEQKGSKKTRRRRQRVSDASGEAFMDSAREAGRAWDSPGVRGRIRNWQGADAVEGSLNNGTLSGTTTDLARPEGATLRRWDA